MVSMCSLAVAATGDPTATGYHTATADGTATATDHESRKPLPRSRSLSPEIEDFRDDKRASLSRTKRDILALRTARENRAALSDYMNASAPRPFSPPGEFCEGGL